MKIIIAIAFYIVCLITMYIIIEYIRYIENKKFKEMLENANSDEQLLDILYNMYKLKQKYKR
jgi:hypothetical protein